MLRFNVLTKLWGCGIYTISIHLMLRFNYTVDEIYHILVRFQYILCYGSTVNFLKGLVNFLGFQYILCYGSTEFKTAKSLYVIAFQYILCYGSTLYFLYSRQGRDIISIHLMLRFNIQMNNGLYGVI